MAFAALLLGLLAGSPVAAEADATLTVLVQVDSVQATGPGAGTTLEDRVEIAWPDTAIANTSGFTVTRDGELIHFAASTERLFYDLTSAPGQTYEYCVHVVNGSNEVEAELGCDEGGRVIARPTGFTASDGMYEQYVQLEWTDRSEIEAGYTIYRDAGGALRLDGTDDFVSTSGLTDLTSSFTFEFWARRASTGTDDFVINLETNPSGDPTDEDVEIGFGSSDRFEVRFGGDVLATDEAYLDTDWHHWAVVYDAPNRRRFIYRDGVEVKRSAFSIVSAPTGDLEFGRRDKNGSTRSRGHFDGALDEIGYWSRALTADEVQGRISGLVRGDEEGLAGYWPMDVKAGLVVPDVQGSRTGALENASGSSWTTSGAAPRYRQVAAGLNAYVDLSAVVGFQDYRYRLAAFEDMNSDGVFEVGTDYESQQQRDRGWRAYVTPPGSVSATDGQYNDRVRVTWLDQSEAEDSYAIYRDGSLIGTAEAGAQSFEDLAPASLHEYCVAAVASGIKSVRTCDTGQAGALPPPAEVAASRDTLDAYIAVSWSDTSETESGFEIYRGAPNSALEEKELLAELGAGTELYNDRSARQDVEYEYCVRALSEADPLDPSYSEANCATGRRAVVLAPTDLVVSEDAFEDRVELAWSNPATTALAFRVYRGDSLIQVLDFTRTSTQDAEIPSDTDVEYCVSAVTVVGPEPTTQLQGEVAQVLQTIEHDDAVSVSMGGAVTTPLAKMAAVREAVGMDLLAKTAAADASGLYESDEVCASGRRSIAGPTGVLASTDQESHVRVEWADNSSIEIGYLIYRAPAGGGGRIRLDSLSRGRTTFEDYAGAPGTRYIYTVEALDAYDVSRADSAEGVRRLEPPAQLTASQGASETEVTLEWKDKSSAETGYAVSWRRAGSGLPFASLDTTAVNEKVYVHAVSGSALGVDLEYQLAAVDAYGSSRAVTTQGYTFLRAPSSVNASGDYQDAVVVVWVDRSDVEGGYILERRLDGVVEMSVDTRSTLYRDESAEVGVDYQYCVRKVADESDAPPSEERCDRGLRPEEGGSTGGGGEDPGDEPVVVARAALVTSQWTWGTESIALAPASLPSREEATLLLGQPVADTADVDADGLTWSYAYVDTVGVWVPINPDSDTEPIAYTGSDESYGWDVAISDSFAIVGAPLLQDSTKGGFEVREGGPGFGESSKRVTIEADSSLAGFSVAMADSFAVIGDPLYEEGSASGGSVLVCDVKALLADEATCTHPDAPDLAELVVPRLQDDAEFGYDVDMVSRDSALYVLAGAPGGEQAYLFTCDRRGASCGALGDWSLEETLGQRVGTDKRFGATVAISSEIAVIGAPGATPEAESGLQVFEWTEEGLDDRTAQQYQQDGFALSLDVDSTFIIVGAPYEHVGGAEDAGRVYVMEWRGGPAPLSEPVIYDQSVVEDVEVADSSYFGAAVTVDAATRPGWYGVATRTLGSFLIPFDQASSDGITGGEVVAAGRVRASDGTSPDRIRVQWDDESDGEDGYFVYRSSEDGRLELLDEVGANVDFYNDTDAAPGEAYDYCVTAFIGNSETEPRCDIGWRRPNGSISGRIAVGDGAGTDGAQVCLEPSPNRSMLFDGVGGYVEAVAQEALDLESDFTIEAWVRPQRMAGPGYVIAKENAYALSLSDDGRLVFELFLEDGDQLAQSAAQAIKPGFWYHVAATKDAGGMRVYIDAVRAGFNAYAGPASIAGDRLTIGQSDDANFFDGEIDELRIWKVARTPEQLRALRTKPLTGEEEGLVGYWSLDQGERRVVPDQTATATHGRVVSGAYVTDEGADLDVCATTGEDGNYTISNIRYREATDFRVRPARAGRTFTPSFAPITLSRESPVQNEMRFSDVTAYEVAGYVQYVDTLRATDGAVTGVLSCPVPDAQLYASKSEVFEEGDQNTATEADGSFALALDPSTAEDGDWFIHPRYPNPESGAAQHVFEPDFRRVFLESDTTGINFQDQHRSILTGAFAGGDLATCGEYVGAATIRVYTQDGCYDRTFTVDSGPEDDGDAYDFYDGRFELDLPPLEYLLEVVAIENAPAERAEDIERFFAELGSVEFDLTQGDTTRNLIYRAPLKLAVEWVDLQAPACPNDQFEQYDEDDNLLRTLPAVPVIPAEEFAGLVIKVQEDYGSSAGVCDVNDGTVTIIDAIRDREDTDSTLAITKGKVEYETYGRSPNVFSGMRIGGVDRSFQKPITFIAQVEGRPTITETRWAIVEGFRERAATFVSATTEEMPLLILHDPPGSNSYAYLEEGTTVCNRYSNLTTFGGGAGVELDFALGFKGEVGFSLGAHSTTKYGAGLVVRTRTVGGQERTTPDGDNFEVCLNTTKKFATSDDPGFVGEDIYVGVALNLIFALADVVDVDPATCQVDLSETIATDLDSADPFETTYAYGKSHIAYSLIPELQNLIDIGGDASVEGEIGGTATTTNLTSALENWRRHLQRGEDAKDAASEGVNRSFSGGADYEHAETKDRTTVTAFESTNIYIDSESTIGAIVSINDYDNIFAGTFEVKREWLSEEETVKDTTTTIGYVLSDGDTGDYFSVDIGDDPDYGTKVFNTVSGRSSNPWESNTQKRDQAMIAVDPPVQFDVDPAGMALFDVSLINASESDEVRRYVLQVPPETNPNGAGIKVAGAPMGGTKEYVLEPGKALTVTMEVRANPSAFSYRDVGLMLYPPDEYPIWGGDPRLPFATADTAFFDVYYDSTGGNLLTASMDAGWNWISTNREGGDVATVLGELPAEHGDILRSQDGESRFDSTRGWTGELTRIAPGAGYRLRLHQPTYFRAAGEPVELGEPMALRAGWNWIGYLPARAMPVGEAMASVEDRLMEGDAVVSQHAFAQYVEGTGWVGTLRDMKPGESYAVHLERGGELLFPQEPEEREPREPVVRETTVRGPEWKAQAARYDATMTVVAEVEMRGLPLEQTTMKVAALDGELVRGTGEVRYVEALGRYLTFIMLYGPADEESDLVIHVYDGETDELYEEVATVRYAAQGRLGHPARPVVIDLANAGQAPALLDLPTEFALHPNYPNPFTTSTMIGYDLPQAAVVRMDVFDLLGRRVAVLVDGEQQAGRHRVQLDGRTLASGLYMYRMAIGESRYVGKMIVVK